MAIVASLPREGGTAEFYKIPDADLAKYRVQTEALTPDKAKEMLGKDQPSASDAHAVVPTEAMGGDVQPNCYRTCYYDPGPQVPYYYWWCC